MGTWALWIAFNAGVTLLLLLDLAMFHRRAHVISMREAALESAGWVALSVGFGAWVYFSHGSGPGLEFFTGYVVEKSLSMDNVFVFLLIFQYFRVDPRHQHRLLFWGVLGALVLRGVMIGAGAALIVRFEWILYVFGAFLLYSGFKLFGADHTVHPEKNPLVRWAQKHLRMSEAPVGQKLIVRQGGQWMFTPLFLVVIVLETTDLILAVDSIPAVFGVTRDPFIVYSSNVCAILGLRALYFLLAGILPYFQYLDEGLAITVMFIGAKMLADPWVHISTGQSLAVVGGVIALSILISVFRARPKAKGIEPSKESIKPPASSQSAAAMQSIAELSDDDGRKRLQAAVRLFSDGTGRIADLVEQFQKDAEFGKLIVQERIERPSSGGLPHPRLTVGIAVNPGTFEKIRASNGSPALAQAPADQDVLEFELDFPAEFVMIPRLDILTTNALGGSGAIARFLEKFGEGIQQIEMDVTDAHRATEILRTKFNLAPIYPEARAGADGTRVNFFLVPRSNGQKVLLELVEQAKRTT
jgi:tellurite resistance protein TerC